MRSDTMGGLRVLMLAGALAAGGYGLANAQVTGSLEGTVTLGGDSLPGPTTVENSTDPAVCGQIHTLQDLVVSGESRGVRNTMVALVNVPDEQIPDPSPERLVIDNRDCQFFPHASVATIGDTVVARNSDPTLHNTHYYGPMGSNIALAAQGMTGLPGGASYGPRHRAL